VLVAAMIVAEAKLRVQTGADPLRLRQATHIRLH